MVIKVNKLGLAAYIKMIQQGLIRYDNNSSMFEFESEIDLEQWKLRYIQSCCRRHDAELMDLRDMFVKK